jgi:hypothetical protein
VVLEERKARHSMEKSTDSIFNPGQSGRSFTIEEMELYVEECKGKPWDSLTWPEKRKYMSWKYCLNHMNTNEGQIPWSGREAYQKRWTAFLDRRE